MLTIDNIVQSYDGQTVLHGISLHVKPGEIVCLLGPSGCGKTTLLRVIAGLEQADSGDVCVAGESVLQLPVHKRNFSLMFQDFALFPHMNVAQNVAFGLRMRGANQSKQQQRLSEVLDLVGLRELEKRDVTQLSGGEKQRVALARSLAPEPRLLMLDEPLGSLDAALKDRLVVELHDIIKQIGLTTLYITHDQHEAYAIADRVAVMNAGRIEQIDTPEDLYQSPRTEFAARFLGLSNIVPVHNFAGHCADTDLGQFAVAGKPDALLLHPDGLTLASPDAPGAIAGRLVECTFVGSSYRLKLEHESGLQLSLTHQNMRSGRLQTGDLLAIQVAPEWIVPLQTP